MSPSNYEYDKAFLVAIILDLICPYQKIDGSLKTEETRKKNSKTPALSTTINTAGTEIRIRATVVVTP